MERLLNQKYLKSSKMVMKNKLVSFVFIGFILFSFSTFVLAEEMNLTDSEKVQLCIEDSELIIGNLLDGGFSVDRINDSFKEIQGLYDFQLNLESKGRQADYSNIIKSCENINELRDLAFDLRDQIDVLKNFREDSLGDIESEDVDELFSQIEREMNNERYELVPDLIEKTYSEITIVQSKMTTLNVFYDATTRGIKRFFEENWKVLLIVVITIVSLFLLLKKSILKAIFNNRLKLLELRKKSLKDLITKNQDEYFNSGKISEESFTIKSKKLVELVRDVERDISLIKERIYLLDNKKDLNKSESKKEDNKKKNKKK